MSINGKNGKRDIPALVKDGRAVDRAVAAAFVRAVRRHRQAGVPMAMDEKGAVLLVSPYEIRLPEEEQAPGNPPGWSLEGWERETAR